MDDKAVGYAALASGAVVLFAGVKGYSVLKAVQNLIAGKAANEGQNVSLINAGDSSGGSSASGVSAPSGPGEKAFWTAVLTSIGAPPSSRNIGDMVKWRTRECPWNNQPPDGAQYTHNPLNTTLVMGSSNPINSVGVQKYPNAVTGVKATVQTLKGGYPNIIGSLRRNHGLSDNTSGDFLKWSGGAYSGV
jgi:hypothetical protein